MHNTEAGDAQLVAVLRSQPSCTCYHVIYLQMSSHSHIAEPKSWWDTPYSFHQHHTWPLETSQGPPMGWRSHKRRAKGKWGYSKTFQCIGDDATLNVKNKSLLSSVCMWMWKLCHAAHQQSSKVQCVGVISIHCHPCPGQLLVSATFGPLVFFKFQGWDRYDWIEFNTYRFNSNIFTSICVC